MACNFVELNLLPESQSVLLNLSECSMEDFKYLPEIEYSNSLGVEKRRKEFLAGRACAHEALLRCNVDGAATQSLLVSDDGLPTWPLGVIGCISHSNYLAIASVLGENTFAIGVDVEPVMSAESARSIEEHVLSKYELSLIRGRRYEEAVTLIFSVKESIFKALFPFYKTFLEFSDVQVLEIRDRTVSAKVKKVLGSSYSCRDIFEVQYFYFLDHVICGMSVVTPWARL